MAKAKKKTKTTAKRKPASRKTTVRVKKTTKKTVKKVAKKKPAAKLGTLKLKKKIDDKLLKNKINLKGLKKKHTHYH